MDSVLVALKRRPLASRDTSSLPFPRTGATVTTSVDYEKNQLKGGRHMRMTSTGRARMMTLSLVVTAVATSCTSGSTYLPPSPGEVSISLDEYQIELATPVVAGRSVVRVSNIGTMTHELRLSPWPDDSPPVKEVLADSGPGQVVQLLARVSPLGPGEDGAFAVDLAPGRYALACFLQNPDGSLHARKGMAIEIQVSG